MERNMFFTLGCMKLDLALREDEPPALTNSSTLLEIAKYEW